MRARPKRPNAPADEIKTSTSSQETALHTDIEQNLIAAYHKHLASLDT